MNVSDLSVSIADFYAIVAQHAEVFFNQRAVTFHEVWQFRVAYAQAVSPCFIHVCGAYAFECRAYFGLSFGRFGCGVQKTVRGKYQVRFA